MSNENPLPRVQQGSWKARSQAGRLQALVSCVASTLALAACATVPGSGLGGTSYGVIRPSPHGAVEESAGIALPTPRGQSAYEVIAPSTRDEGPADDGSWLMVRGVRFPLSLLDGHNVPGWARYLVPLRSCLRSVQPTDLKPGLSEPGVVQVPITAIRWSFHELGGAGLSHRLSDIHLAVLGTTLPLDAAEKLNLDVSIKVNPAEDPVPPLAFEARANGVSLPLPPNCRTLGEPAAWPTSDIPLGISGWFPRPRGHTLDIQVREKRER